MLERVLACCDIAQTDRYQLSERELTSAHEAAVGQIEATRNADEAAPAEVDYANPPGLQGNDRSSDDRRRNRSAPGRRGSTSLS